MDTFWIELLYKYYDGFAKWYIQKDHIWDVWSCEIISHDCRCKSIWHMMIIMMNIQWRAQKPGSQLNAWQNKYVNWSTYICLFENSPFVSFIKLKHTVLVPARQASNILKIHKQFILSATPTTMLTPTFTPNSMCLPDIERYRHYCVQNNDVW